MGSTRRSQTNHSNPIDSRQIHETTTTVDIERRIEDSNNTTNELDLRDESEGSFRNIGGNVTVESEAVSIAAIEENARLIEELAEEQRRTQESNNALEEQRAAEARRIADINAQIERDRAENNRRIQEQQQETQRRFAEEQRRASEAAISGNTSVSIAGINATQRIANDALEQGTRNLQDALKSNNQTVADTLSFLEEDEEEDRKLLEKNLEFLGETIEGSNELVTTSLTEAFKSTVGGFADAQQKTLLAGLAVLAVLMFILNFRKA